MIDLLTTEGRERRALRTALAGRPFAVRPDGTVYVGQRPVGQCCVVEDRVCVTPSTDGVGDWSYWTSIHAALLRLILMADSAVANRVQDSGRPQTVAAGAVRSGDSDARGEQR